MSGFSPTYRRLAAFSIPLKFGHMKNDAFLYDALYQALNNGQIDARQLEQVRPSSLLDSNYVKQYTPLVRRLAHQMIARLPANVELDDMIQAGMMGLMDAVSRFEVTQGTQFEVYAAQRIRGAMLDELRANDWLPRSARKSQRDIENAIHRLEGKLGRAPQEAEIAGELEMSLAAVSADAARRAWRAAGASGRSRRQESTTKTISSDIWLAILLSRRKYCATSAFAMRWSMQSMSCPSAKSF